MSLFTLGSIVLRFGMVLKPRVYWGAQGFAEGLRHLVSEKQQIQEIPKGQRFLGRPSLKKLFSQTRGKGSRDQIIAKAVTRYGYSQMELASFLGLHYSTISGILAATDKQQI